MGEVNLFDEPPSQPGLMTEDQIDGPAPSGVMFDDIAAQDETEPSDQEQRDYAQIVNQAMKFIHGPKSDTVLEAMNQKSLPVEHAVGRFAAKLGKMIKQNAESHGAQLSDAAIREAFTQEIIPELIEVGQNAGLWDLSEAQADKIAGEAGLAAAKSAGESMLQAGNLPQDEAKAFLDSQNASIELGGEQAPMAAAVQQANAGVANKARSGEDLFSV